MIKNKARGSRNLGKDCGGWKKLSNEKIALKLFLELIFSLVVKLLLEIFMSHN